MYSQAYTVTIMFIDTPQAGTLRQRRHERLVTIEETCHVHRSYPDNCDTLPAALTHSLHWGHPCSQKACSPHVVCQQKSREPGSRQTGKIPSTLGTMTHKGIIRQGHLRRILPKLNSKKCPLSPKVNSAYLNSQWKKLIEKISLPETKAGAYIQELTS